MNQSHLPATSSARSMLRPQIALSTILLLIATLATWLGYWNVRRDTEKLRSHIPGLLSVVRELEVTDPMKSAAVARVPEWFDECIWDIYLPESGSFELCLALDKIEANDLADAVQRVRIDPGYSSVELKYETETDVSIASVLIDGQIVMEEAKPKNWEPRRGSSGGSEISRSVQFDPAKPLVLYRKRFRGLAGTRVKAGTPTPGILVWIQPVKEIAETEIESR
jgi:hypothetical protein